MIIFTEKCKNRKILKWRIFMISNGNKRNIKQCECRQRIFETEKW